MFALAALIAACSGPDAEDDANEGASQENPPLATEPAPELGLDMLQAATPAGTVDVERDWENMYVGAVTEDLYIAVSPSEVSDTSHRRGPRSICAMVKPPSI